MWLNMLHNQQIRQMRLAAQKILSDLGLSAANIQVSVLKGGNNRVYKVSAADKSYILKQYFRSDSDTRNRLAAEFSFLTYAQECRIRSIPLPVSCDTSADLGFYEFIEGTKLNPGEVEKEHVCQCFEFISILNQKKFRKLKAAASLPLASDACLSVKDHIYGVNSRVKTFLEMDVRDDVDREARVFMSSSLFPAWKSIRESLNVFSTEEKTLKKTDLIISPSDFGFHNAILKKDQALIFIDFEYAGWDDPAKLICDFFCQPQVPVPFQHINNFINSVNEALNPDYDLEMKIKYLMPLHRMKWCCIMLNDFLQTDGKRKQFASMNKDNRIKQLEKAVAYAKEHRIL